MQSRIKIILFALQDFLYPVAGIGLVACKYVVNEEGSS